MREAYGEEDDREPVLLVYHGTTDKSWCVSRGDGERFFLPLSRVDTVKPCSPDIGKAGEFLVPKWLRDKYDLD